MSVTKDGNTGKWMAQLRVTDWTGKTVHKKKRGFKTKREAQQWEQDFLQQASGSIGMTFQDFIELYLKDMEQRLKPSTVANKRFLIDLKITPFFGRPALAERADHLPGREGQALLCDLPQDHQQSDYRHLQLCRQVLRAKRKSLPQGREHGQEERGRNVVLDEG